MSNTSYWIIGLYVSIPEWMNLLSGCILRKYGLCWASGERPWTMYPAFSRAKSTSPMPQPTSRIVQLVLGIQSTILCVYVACADFNADFESITSCSESEYPKWNDSNFKTSRQNRSSKSTALARSGWIAMYFWGIILWYELVIWQNYRKINRFNLIIDIFPMSFPRQLEFVFLCLLFFTFSVLSLHGNTHSNQWFWTHWASRV